MSEQENKPQAEEPKPQQQPSMDEKSEEKNEKEDEKFEEKHHRDPLSSLIWALILIWAGLVFMAANLGWLNSIQTTEVMSGVFTFAGLSTWSVIFMGAGVLVFIEAVIRTFVPAYRSSTGGNFFLAAIFLGIGFSAIFGWQAVWPFILIAMGLSALASALIRRH
jgi:cation transport ATPase